MLETESYLGKIVKLLKFPFTHLQDLEIVDLSEMFYTFS